MTNGTEFSSPEEMMEAFNQLWEDLASFFTDIPSYFSQALEFAGENPLALIVVSLFLTLLAFYFIRCIISSFSGSRR